MAHPDAVRTWPHKPEKGSHQTHRLSWNGSKMRVIIMPMPFGRRPVDHQTVAALSRFEDPDTEVLRGTRAELRHHARSCRSGVGMIRTRGGDFRCRLSLRGRGVGHESGHACRGPAIEHVADRGEAVQSYRPRAGCAFLRFHPLRTYRRLPSRQTGPCAFTSAIWTASAISRTFARDRRIGARCLECGAKRPTWQECRRQRIGEQPELSVYDQI